MKKLFGWSRASLLSTADFARWIHLLPPRDAVCRVPAGQPRAHHARPKSRTSMPSALP